MKKSIFLFLFIVSLGFSQPIHVNNIIVSPINSTDINVNVNTSFFSVFYYFNHEVLIENNTIILNICYYPTWSQFITTVENDFEIPNINIGQTNYTLIVNAKIDVGPTSPYNCDNPTFMTTKTLQFSTILTSPVTLATNSFSNNNFSISPNPAQDYVNIQFENQLKSTTVSLQNTLGQIIKKEKFVDSKTIHFPIIGESGVYFLTIENENGEKITRRILKK